jgi:hypothetical protein
MLVQLRFVTSESAFDYFRATRAYLAGRAAILKPGVLRASICTSSPRQSRRRRG